MRSISLSFAVLWGFAMLFVGIAHLADPRYGAQFLAMMSSVYPGADTAPTMGRVLLGALYGFGDGAVAGLLFGLLYHGFAGGAHGLSGSKS
ncbi:MAG TPA: hypothetical protein VMU19_01540 [Bryobacteraceae bacterium]|nr:hypothetical protein [Bryobacteraceae bacterium]